jgi:hypothetical protein
LFDRAAGRHRSELVVAINWNGWSFSIGTGGRHHMVRALCFRRWNALSSMNPKKS